MLNTYQNFLTFRNSSLLNDRQTICPFLERDVINDQTPVDGAMRIGVITTPGRVIDGKVVGGFNRKRVEEFLAGEPGWLQVHG